MHTKTLMTLSAVLMAIVGLAAAFFPREILQYMDAWEEVFEVGIMQVAGALYLSLATLNWTARTNVIGGLYGRPVVLANFMHAGIMTAILGKVALTTHSIELVSALTIYIIFAIWFGAVLFATPKTTKFTPQE